MIRQYKYIGHGNRQHNGNFIGPASIVEFEDFEMEDMPDGFKMDFELLEKPMDIKKAQNSKEKADAETPNNTIQTKTSKPAKNKARR